MAYIAAFVAFAASHLSSSEVRLTDASLSSFIYPFNGQHGCSTTIWCVYTILEVRVAFILSMAYTATFVAFAASRLSSLEVRPTDASLSPLLMAYRAAVAAVWCVYPV
jgi:hypothetical protein